MEGTQTISYPCCKKVFAACRIPECYTDSEWLRDLKKYAKKGYVVGFVKRGDPIDWSECQCNKTQQPKQQLELF